MYLSLTLSMANPTSVRKVIFEKFSPKGKDSRITRNELQKNPLLRRERIYEEINCLENIGLSGTIWSRKNILISPGKRTIHMVFEWIEGEWGKHEGLSYARIPRLSTVIWWWMIFCGEHARSASREISRCSSSSRGISLCSIFPCTFASVASSIFESISIYPTMELRSFW